MIWLGLQLEPVRQGQPEWRPVLREDEACWHIAKHRYDGSMYVQALDKHAWAGAIEVVEL